MRITKKQLEKLIKEAVKAQLQEIGDEPAMSERGVTMFDLDQLKKAEMFAHTLAQKLEKLRQQVENGAPSPHMVRDELDLSYKLTEHVRYALRKTDERPSAVRPARSMDFGSKGILP